MKTFFETLREIAWAVVVLLGVGGLLVAVIEPALFAQQMAKIFSALETEGFDVKLKVPFAEASFDRLASEVAATDAELLEARARIDELTVELVNLRLAAPLPAPSGGLSSTPDFPGITSNPTQPIIEEPIIEAPVLVGPSSEWAVIAGAETDLQSQRTELQALQQAGFDDAVILKSGKWYQSSVIYQDRAAAEAGLRDVEAVVGVKRGAYIRAMEVMCPYMDELPGEADVYECG